MVAVLGAQANTRRVMCQVESQMTANQLEALRRMLGSSVERSDAVAQVGDEAATATAVGA